MRQAEAEKRLALIPVHLRRSRVPENDWPPGYRFCSGCQSFVLLEDASGSRCRTCANVAAHGSSMSRYEGMDRDAYYALLKLQGGRCAICRAKPLKYRLAVDHDHKTGVVRGLCCKLCNMDLLQAAHHDVTILRNAVAYLENPPAIGGWTIPETAPAPY